MLFFAINILGVKLAGNVKNGPRYEGANFDALKKTKNEPKIG